MGIFGEIEHVAGDVAHAGEEAVHDIGSMLTSLHDFLTDAGLGNVAQELEQLAEQANRLKQQLATAESGTHWSGAAAEAFRQHAQERRQQLTELVSALDSAHSAVAAAYAIAGIF